MELIRGCVIWIASFNPPQVLASELQEYQVCILTASAACELVLAAIRRCWLSLGIKLVPLGRLFNTSVRLTRLTSPGFSA